MKVLNWLGLVTGKSPYSLKAGEAQDQENLQIYRDGELIQRPGMSSIYTANDYSAVVGVYRVSRGSALLDDIVLANKPNASTTDLYYLSTSNPGVESAWTAVLSASSANTSLRSPSFCEDRNGRIYAFQGNGAAPLVLSPVSKTAVNVGLTAPTAAPQIAASGTGYFIERVDVLDGGGGYWGAPPIVIAGGTPIQNAQLRAVVQGGSIVAVDVVDGGAGYLQPPTLTVNEGVDPSTGLAWKGFGFFGTGVIGSIPAVSRLLPFTAGPGNASTTVNPSTISNFVVPSTNILAGMPVTINGTVQAGTVQSYTSPNLVMTAGSSVTATSAQIVVNAPAITGATTSGLSHGFGNNTADMSVAYKLTATGNVANVGGFAAVTITSGNIGQLAVGMLVSGTGLPASNGTTLNYSITVINTTTNVVTLSAAATATGNGRALTITAAARATFDSANGTWSATFPITPQAGSAGSGASARIVFGQAADGASHALGGTPTAPAGGLYQTSYPSSTAGIAPFVADDALYRPGAPGLLATTADYFVNSDDYTQYPDNIEIPQQAQLTPWKWDGNNWDFFAGLTPAYDFTGGGMLRKFVKRKHVLSGRNTTTGAEIVYYADTFSYDYTYVSYRYYTGAADAVNTAADDASRWAWGHSIVQTNANGPFIDVTLTPSLKTGTIPYIQYSGYSPPVVRIYLEYAPSTWNNTNNTAAQDTGLAVLPGWQRGNPATFSAANSTNLGWYNAGAATSGTLPRPIVYFRIANASSTGGIASGTVATQVAGAGMEGGTFFAIQFDNINASDLFFNALSTSITSGVNGGNVYAPGGFANVFTPWDDTHKLPGSPTFINELNRTLANFSKTKSFNFSGRLRFYFTANLQQSTTTGPPGNVSGTPLLLSPGTGYLLNETGTITLRQRTSSTAPLSTAVFNDGNTYTFRSWQISPAYSTNAIASVNISSQGVNYYGAPRLIVSNGGGGFGAELDAVVSNGAITNISVRSGGSGYTIAPSITVDSETAVLFPSMRPGMKGIYRCAYRFADYSQTAVVETRVSTTNGSRNITLESISGVEPGFVVDNSDFPFPTRILSIGTAASPNQCVVDRAATATRSLSSVTVRDFERPIIYSNFSPITDFDTATSTSTAPTTLTWTIPRVNAPARAGIVEFFRTSADQSLVFYRLEMYGRISGSSLSIVGTDTLTDEQLFNSDRPFYGAVPVVLPNGGLNAYRFGVPRADMAACATFGDRLWYGVSTSGQNANSVFYSEYDEFESCPDINEIVVQNNLKSTDSLTALVPFSQYLLAMQSSHCYAISYNSDPGIDANVQLLASRGALTQQCCDLFDDRLYCMDERGVYVLDRSGAVESLSDNIQTFFDEGLLDLSKREAFFVKVDQRTSTLRAFVVLAGSGCSTPNIALCFNLAAKQWWIEQWPTGLTCAVDYRPADNAQDVPIYGALDGDLYQFEGTRDFPFRAIASVAVTNGGSGYTTPPTVSAGVAQAGGGAMFTAVVQGGVVTDILIDRPGFGYGTLTGTYASGTFNQSVPLTITGGGGAGGAATATTYPLTVSAGTLYPRSSVDYRFKTGAMELISDANARTKDQQIDRSVTVTYRPTPIDAFIFLREYFNNSSSPRSNVMARDRGTGFIHDTTGARTTLNMSATRSPLGPATGVAQARFAGRAFTDNAGADRHLAVELTAPAATIAPGAAVPPQIMIYGLEVAGAKASGD